LLIGRGGECFDKAAKSLDDLFAIDPKLVEDRLKMGGTRRIDHAGDVFAMRCESQLNCPTIRWMGLSKKLALTLHASAEARDIRPIDAQSLGKGCDRLLSFRRKKKIL
jgi:hypothetical protein